jgi:hypothetical protein
MTLTRLTILLGIALLIGACSSVEARSTGFLSDYTHLTAGGKAELSYFNPSNGLENYTGFIIEPTIVHMHEEASDSVDEDESRELTKHMDAAIRAALAVGYDSVSQPGPGVARIRVAITDLEKGNAVLNVIPIGMITGVGLGALAIEGEIVDSRTGEQVAAVIDSIEGGRLSGGNFSSLGDAKSALDEWAKRLRLRLDEAHGR